MLSLEKLRDKMEPGKVVSTEGAKHTTYSYVLNDVELFAFGITRSSKAKSKFFNYVSRQMALKKAEYRELHNCPMSKADFNKLVQPRLL
jgi:hypothetical protein